MGQRLIRNKYSILILLLITALFYWFQLRPSQIRADCMKKNLDYFSGKGNINAALAEPGDDFYKACLRGHGLAN